MGSIASTVMGLLLLCVSATSGFAAQPVGAETDFGIPLPAEQSAYLYHPDARLAADPAARALMAQLAVDLGSGWTVLIWNPHARTARLAAGPAIPAGSGSLQRADAAAAERVARRFISEHKRTFGTDGTNLVLLKAVHARSRWAIVFAQVEQRIPILGATVILALTDDGCVVALGSNVHRDIPVPLEPTIARPVAVALARSAVPFDPTLVIPTAPDELLLLPIHRAEELVEYHLVYRIDVPTRRPFGLWRTYVDAHDGSIIYRTNEVHRDYGGNSSGDVEILSYCDGNSSDIPFASMDIAISGVGTATTDRNGAFSIAGGAGPRSYVAHFYGPEADVNCFNCGGDATLTGTIEPGVPESLYFAAGAYRPDERDAFYSFHRAKHFVVDLDPQFTLPRYNVNVNMDYDYCDAWWYYPSTIDLLHEYGGCPNTARMGDLVAHELGHGVQGELLGSGNQGEQGLGEGNSDIIATFISDVPLVFRGFFSSCSSGLRTCLNTLRYPDDVIGHEIHDAGRVICGFNWDARVLLEAKMGGAAGKAYCADLWHYSRKLYADPFWTQPDQVFAYFLVDDDDNNVMNGTPNYTELCTAATNHGFACPAGVEAVNIAHTPIGDTANPGPFTVSATVTVDGPYPLAPGSPAFYWSVNGSLFASVAMNHLGGSTYEAQIPAQTAGTAIAYYIEGINTNGVGATSPPGAPGNYHLFGIGAFDVLLDDDVEVDRGWTISEPGSDGTWERADPNGTRFILIPVNPEDDHTPAPGVTCWVTGNPPPGSPPAIEEVDGRTSLVSPVMDMQGSRIARGTVWLWAYFGAPAEDHLDMSVSTDGGVTWVLIRRLAASGLNQWREYPFTLGPFDITLTSQMRFRFSAEDGGADTTVDCAMDDFSVRALAAEPTAVASTAPTRRATKLHPSQPNPFSSQTEIRYGLAGRAPVRIAVFDVGGRELCVLADAVGEPGEHVVTWDGRDAAGRLVPSGVYFCRLSTASYEHSQRIVLVR